MFKFVLESLFLASKNPTFSAKSVRIENGRGDKIVDELELGVVDVVVEVEGRLAAAASVRPEFDPEALGHVP